MYAAANGLSTLAQNRDKVGAFFKLAVPVQGVGARVRARRRRDFAQDAAARGGVKGVLGPSMLYGCTMRLCASAGMPSLVAVGGANVATPLLVSKLGGSLQAMPGVAGGARLPIAAHCMIEWGLFQRFKEHLARAAGGRAEMPRALPSRASPRRA